MDHVPCSGAGHDFLALVISHHLGLNGCSHTVNAIMTKTCVLLGMDVLEHYHLSFVLAKYWGCDGLPHSVMAILLCRVMHCCH